MRKAFFNIYLDVYDRNEAYDLCREILLGTTSKSLFFVNAHCFNMAQSNPEYRKVLNESDLIFNDGIGVKLGLYFAGIKAKDNLNGTDLIPDIIKMAVSLKKKIYFLGGRRDIAYKAKLKLEEEYEHINIVGSFHGYFTPEEEAFIKEDINRLEVDVLIVGMGVPTQELWVSKVKPELKTVKLIIGGGAVIDFMSGTIPRAPVWIRNNNLEWVYRLYLEPKRMWRRYTIGNIIYFYHILRFRFSKKAVSESSEITSVKH